jgi:hypothetical protein
MNERMIWVFRIIAIFVFLLLAYLMMSLHAKLQRMNRESETRAFIENRVAETNVFLESRVAATSCSPGREPNGLNLSDP